MSNIFIVYDNIETNIHKIDEFLFFIIKTKEYLQIISLFGYDLVKTFSQLIKFNNFKIII